MKKTIHFLVSAVFVCVSLASATFAAPAGREVRDFNADWLFHSGDEDTAGRIDFVDEGWRKLSVPHDWSIEGPIDVKNTTGKAGGFMPSGIGWYRKHFFLAADQSKRRVFIEFDGVMANSEVWVNGFNLGKRPNGYSSFGYDLSDHLNFGKDNVIAVRADNAGQPASRWYTGAGIYRNVRLVITDAVRLEKWSTFITTPTVSAENAVVKVSTKAVNAFKTPKQISLEVKLYDDLGKLVGTSKAPGGTLPGDGSLDLNLEMNIKAPRRWNLETPYLYKAVVSVISGGKAIDAETVNFGVRSFEFVPATGFWLNGKNFKIKGACLHHDGSAFGAAVPLAVWEHRLNELRKLGVNAIRTAHNPPAPEFLDLTDRMGFLVMDELFDQWTRAKNPFDYHKDFNEWSEIDVRDTVRRDRNHPSVIIYSAGNEIRDNHADQEKAKQTLKKLVDTFHENDPTRPVTQALFRPNIEGANDYQNGLAEILDVVGQNYREKEILAAYKQKPTRKIIGTENAHDLNQWVAMRDNPEYSGQFIWAGIDYLGESPAWPDYAFGRGLLDRTATPRELGFQRQSWWAAKPMVHIARRVAPFVATSTDPGYEPGGEQKRNQTLYSDWTPKNLAAHEENVEIYSNCDEVELFLNGKSLGSKPKPADDSARNWKVNFESGTIKAVGKNAGKVSAEFELTTAGKPAKIVLSTNKPAITYDWNDVLYIKATVVDANGVTVPTANDLINFAAAGSGIIAAVDSGDNADHDPFQTTKRKAFQGSCFAYVKANKNAGTITITASSGALTSNKLSIRVGK